MSFSPINLLQCLIAFQGLLLALYLLIGRRGKRWANRFLAVLLGLFAVQMASNVARDTGWVEGRILLPQLFALLYGPLFFFHVRALAYRAPRWAPEHVFHGVPALTVGVLWLTESLTVRTLAISIFASVGTYLGLCFLLLRRYRGVVDATRAQGDAIRLSWLRWALVLLTWVWILDIVSFATSWAAPGAIERGLTVALFTLLLALVTAIVFHGLRHPELFAGITEEDEALARLAEAPATPPGDDGDPDGRLGRRLRDLMERERPYLDPDLTLAGLAPRAGMTARQLSQLVNNHFGTHFSEFVNGYRIDAAKARLEDPADGATILEILHAVGFHSKSSFNTAFKRRTGATPSQYRKRHQA